MRGCPIVRLKSSRFRAARASRQSRFMAGDARRLRAFTLVELVMVVTILGIIAAIAVPRMTTASTGATSAALQATLTSVRKAIDCYFAEHGRFPGYDPANGSPSGDQFIKQLTKYTDLAGNASDAYSRSYLFGPYLRAPFPKNPTNGLATVHVKATRSMADPADGSVGWVAVLSTGDFGISATDESLDDIGIKEPAIKGGVRAPATTQ